MSKAPTATELLLRYALLGLGAGSVAAGTYGGYKLYQDSVRNESRRKAFDRRRREDAPADIDVPVSPSEAEQLSRQGFYVPGYSKIALFGDLFNHAVGGAAATATAYGAYKGLSGILDAWRKKKQKKENERLRERIENLLEGDPQRQDLKFAAYMDAARDVYVNGLRKQGSVGTSLAVLAALLGSGATISGIAGLKSIGSSKHEKRIKDLRKYLDQQPPSRQDQSLRLRPVLAAPQRYVEAEDAEEQRRRDTLAASY